MVNEVYEGWALVMSSCVHFSDVYVIICSLTRRRNVVADVVLWAVDRDVVMVLLTPEEVTVERDVAGAVEVAGRSTGLKIVCLIVVHLFQIMPHFQINLLVLYQ